MRLKTKRDVAYEFIKSEIVSGGLKPGQRIVIHRIASEVGVSALPVREALLQLEYEHLVSITPHVGAVVALIELPLILNVIEPLAVLEGFATRRVKEQGSAAEALTELERATNEMNDLVGRDDREAFAAENRAFHTAIYEACENEVVRSTVEALWERLDALLGASSFTLIPGRMQGSVDDHRTIIRMLRDPAADPSELEEFARGHKLRTAESLASQWRAQHETSASTGLGVE